MINQPVPLPLKKQIWVLNNPSQFDRSAEQATKQTLADKVNLHWYHQTALEPAMLTRQNPLYSPESGAQVSPQILVTALVKLDAERLAFFPQLEAVIAASTATDYIDSEYCKARGIRVFNTPAYTGASVAEHAFSLVMACAKQLRQADQALHHQASTPVPKPPPAMELAGKCLGIIGMGHIGSQVAQYAQGFGMQVVYTNRSQKTVSGSTPLALNALLSSADIVVMTVPLTLETRYLVGARELQLMKPSAFLVNIGADELIDADSLVNALKSQTIAGAALDVITDYTCYLEAPNMLLTQSRGWYTQESIERRMAGWMATLEAYLEGNDINRIV